MPDAHVPNTVWVCVKIEDPPRKRNRRSKPTKKAIKLIEVVKIEAPPKKKRSGFPFGFIYANPKKGTSLGPRTFDRSFADLEMAPLALGNEAASTGGGGGQRRGV